MDEIIEEQKEKAEGTEIKTEEKKGGFGKWLKGATEKVGTGISKAATWVKENTADKIVENQFIGKKFKSEANKFTISYRDGTFQDFFAIWDEDNNIFRTNEELSILPNIIDITANDRGRQKYYSLTKTKDNFAYTKIYEYKDQKIEKTLNLFQYRYSTEKPKEENNITYVDNRIDNSVKGKGNIVGDSNTANKSTTITANLGINKPKD